MSNKPAFWLFLLFPGIMVLLGSSKCLKKDNRHEGALNHHQMDTSGLEVIAESGFWDSSLVKVEPSDISKAEWSNAEGRKETLSKEFNVWHYAGMEALDSVKSERYFQRLAGLKGESLSPRVNADGLVMKETLTLYGNNMPMGIKLTAFAHPDAAYLFLIHSSDNPGYIFISDSLGIYQRIFGDLRQFWPDGQ